MLAPSEDLFWSVKEREKEEELRLQAEIDGLKARIDMARRVASLQQATGFSDFVKAVRSLRDQELAGLVNDKALTDAGMREQRGRVKALDQVLSILTRDAVNVTLAEQLVERQNLMDEALKRRPIPRPEATP
jgi:hypothetical protein